MPRRPAIPEEDKLLKRISATRRQLDRLSARLAEEISDAGRLTTRRGWPAEVARAAGYTDTYVRRLFAQDRVRIDDGTGDTKGTAA
ncbi:hypothetical protein ABZ464_27335 [Streptomyces sp. NPDC005820]|uniref:hypothetical protein n=1 Tax=Streptomyces sp. NPDC005820 TaxID=3157069 RepID=UPI0034004503